ncbi:MAG: Bax inhibitor-1/YccA family protein [Geminicoccaceae bacterium]|nr:Bax inhibitor-1/YccA family protein [Geminicoccaceae bacterium]MCX7631046.1 Bax inhibitor-1/YccA family protein [Geminicoccaceae bacterium]MDW8123143.1 Bax inhibitor-1/YccA family protein [Geminicoccaceae bacterium]
MAFGMDPRVAQVRGIPVERIDEGLRSYMLSIYNYMGLGLALTGLTAFVVATSPALMALIFGTPLKWVVMLAPLGFVFFLSARVHRMSVGAAQIAFWAFAVAMGLSLASIFLVFTGTSIARVFFITAATFGAVSLYGYTTKRDLSRFGSFLVMGLIGIVIASLVNLFLGSSALQFAISVIGVLVFTGLTAWDTQRLKEEYVESLGEELVAKNAILGALSLYLNFINLFVMMLQLFGQNRE